MFQQANKRAADHQANQTDKAALDEARRYAERYGPSTKVHRVIMGLLRIIEGDANHDHVLANPR